MRKGIPKGTKAKAIWEAYDDEARIELWEGLPPNVTCHIHGRKWAITRWMLNFCLAEKQIHKESFLVMIRKAIKQGVISRQDLERMGG